MENRGGGVGFIGLLTIVFITLKLTGVIDWSWLWVLAPIWISALVGIVLIGAAFGAIKYFDHRETTERRKRAERIAAGRK
ncbi:MAG: hypothetical protein K0Q60_3488 [Microvirga sp.]|jgi:hypothetical protein|nr:hypothetical protein [Microvirga sp.]